MNADGFVEYVMRPFMDAKCPWDWRYQIDRQRGDIDVMIRIPTWEFGMIRERRHSYKIFFASRTISIGYDWDAIQIMERSMRELHRRFAGQISGNSIGYFTLPKLPD